MDDIIYQRSKLSALYLQKRRVFKFLYIMKINDPRDMANFNERAII
jgi:hypothetical protein